MSWSLGVLWGDNKSASIAGDSYAPGHVSPTRQWAGLHGEVPAAHWHATVAGDPTARRCAHTFSLRVWDRVITGRPHRYNLFTNPFLDTLFVTT